jgi:hypothetical protein
MPWFSDCFLKHGLFSILLLSIDLSNPIVPIASLCVGSNILWGEPPCAVLALHCFICFTHPCSIIFPIAHSDTQQQGTWDWTSLICSSVRDGQSECMAMFIIVYMLITMNCQGQSWMDTSSIFWLDYKLGMECPLPLRFDGVKTCILCWSCCTTIHSARPSHAAISHSTTYASATNFEPT